MDMHYFALAEMSYGNVALKTLAPTAENFWLYEFEWLGDNPLESTVIREA